MQKVDAIMPQAIVEISWHKALKSFLCGIKEAFPKLTPEGLKSFAKTYISKLRQKWERYWEREPTKPWQSCSSRNGCRRRGGAGGS